MDAAFWVFAAALTTVVVCSLAGAKYPKGSTVKNELNLVIGAAACVMAVCVLIGLWEAWSPWTFDFQERQ